jgi:hypothetical protein
MTTLKSCLHYYLILQGSQQIEQPDLEQVQQVDQQQQVLDLADYQLQQLHYLMTNHYCRQGLILPTRREDTRRHRKE